jgi:hypothetical protein
MLLKYKAWFFGGAAVGLALPFAINMYGRVMMLGPVRPIALWLLWPTSLLFTFSHSYTGAGAVILFLFTALGNAFLFGWLASLLRNASLAIALFIPVIVWVFSPPSDTSLARQFREHKSDFEELVQMSNHDEQFIRITPTVIETIDGQKIGRSDAQSGLPERRWAEYRRLFKATSVSDGLYRNTTGGDVILTVRGLGKIDPVGSSLGYVYCPVFNEPLGVPPCRENYESAVRGAFRWKRIEPGWYIYERFQRGIE